MKKRGKKPPQPDPTSEPYLPAHVFAAQMDEYRMRFDGGDAASLIHALLLCGKCKAPMPDWVNWELHQAWHRYVDRTADNLGQAFGIEWPKGRHKAAYLKKRKYRSAVYDRVLTLSLLDGRPIDETLFAEVGREFNIGKRLASEYYYSAKKAPLPISISMLIDSVDLLPDGYKPGS